MQIAGSLKLTGIMTDKILQGEFDIPEHTKCPGIYLKMTIPVKNTGGAPAVMSDSERQGLLADFLLNFAYGEKLDFIPYAAQGLNRIQREARFAFGSELEKYGDSTTGLATSIANGATSNLVVFMLLPTGRYWWLGPQAQDEGAMGRWQLRTAQLEVKRQHADLTAIPNAGNFQLNGTVTIDVIPYEVPSKGDPWVVLAEYREYSENTNEVKKLPDGVHLRLSERTQAHASSPLTSLLIKIDDLIIIDGLGSADYIVPYNDIPNLPSEAAISDRETFLYVPRPYVTTKANIPSGKPYIRKNNPSELATLAIGDLYVPIYPADRINKELDFIASEKNRNKPLRFVPLHAVQGRKLVNKALAIMEPLIAFTHDDREFESMPGYVGEPGKRGDFTVPATVLDAAKAEYMRRQAAGEHKAADDVINSLATAIPGAVQSGRGFTAGSSTVHQRVTGFFR